jgi:hypothetical protein
MDKDVGTDRDTDRVMDRDTVNAVMTIQPMSYKKIKILSGNGQTAEKNFSCRTPKIRQKISSNNY